jgi:O-antigen/teichoic acid export membrane protein
VTKSPDCPKTGTARRLNEMRSFRDQVAITLITNFGLSALGVVTGTLLARGLGPAGRGELATIQVWGAFGVTLALLGLPDALAYRVGRQPHRAAELWLTAGVLAAILGTPVLLVAYWVTNFVLAASKESLSGLMAFYMLGFFVLNVVGSLPLSVLQGPGNISAWNALRALPALGWTCIVVYGVVTGSVTVPFLVVGFLASYACAGLVSVMWVGNRVEGRFRFVPEEVRQMLKYGLPVAVSAVPYWLVRGGRLAQLYAASLLGVTPLGYLAVAVAVAEVNLMVPQGLASVVLPRVLRTLRHGGIECAAEELARIVRLTVLVMASSSCLLLLTARWLIPLLFGHRFAPAVSTALLLIAWSAMEGVRIVVAAALRGLGRPGTVLVSDVVCAVGTSLFLLVLIPRLGLMGAGLGTMLGVSGGMYVAWRGMQRFLPATANLIPRPADLGFAVATLGRFVRSGCRLVGHRTKP